MAAEIFHDKSPQKYGARPGSNSQPLDQQSDSLPIALQGPDKKSMLGRGLTVQKK